MTRSLEKSNRHYVRAEKQLPLGVSSNYREWGPERTIYVERAKGGRLWDLDDNEYIDYRLGFGPVILGHCDDRVDAAAREGMKIGGAVALSTVDRAAVFTIHGFCHRMLLDSAFESGAGFDVELLTETQALRDEVLLDFWTHRLESATSAVVRFGIPTSYEGHEWEEGDE